MLGGAWTWSGAAFIFVLVPLAEALGRGWAAPAPTPRRLRDDLPLWLVFPALAALLAGGLGLASDPTRSILERVGAVLSLGLAAGAVGITAAHELIHRSARAERALGWLLLALVNWTHYPIEHVLGHHRTAGTPEDPATAPRGMGLWRFLLRVMLGEVRGAWRLEGERLRRRGAGGGWRHDRRLGAALLTLGANVGVGMLYGARGWLVFVACGLIAVMLLQSVQYVEHYGLARRRRADGSWEPQGPEHAWDAENAVALALLFHLPRHADHHAHAARPYPELEPQATSPRLPGGYAQMILLAMLPPLWRAVMDRRIPACQAAAA